jgi:hypothetical protein
MGCYTWFGLNFKFKSFLLLQTKSRGHLNRNFNFLQTSVTN